MKWTVEVIKERVQMKTKTWSARFIAGVFAMTMSVVSLVAISSAQNPLVRLVMRLGEERTLEDGTKVGISKGDGDFVIVTLSRPSSNQSSNFGTNSTTSTSSNQSFQTRDFLGTWEGYEVSSDYQSGSGRFPSSLRPAMLVKYYNNGISQSASPEDRNFTTPMSTTNWEYSAQTNTTGVMLIRVSGAIGARLRVRWIDENTYEDEILYSNEPAYIGIKRVFKRVRS